MHLVFLYTFYIVMNLNAQEEIEDIGDTCAF